MNTPEHLTPEKIAELRATFADSEATNTEKVFDLILAAPALLVAAELGMAWEAEAKAWREWRRLHDLRGATCRDAESWNAYKEPRENAWMKICDASSHVDQLTGRIGTSTPTP